VSVTLAGQAADRQIVALYVIGLAALVGGGLLVGLLFRWWGLLASIGFACFLAYAWELDSLGVVYAAIAGAVASAGVIAGSLMRRTVSARR
jgi:hypothetical protein